MRSRLAAVLVVFALIGAACGGGGDDEDAATTASDRDSSSEATDDAGTTDGEDEDETAAASGSGSDAKDACAALPRATIQQVVGADPGEGELERASGSTVCRYYGDAKVTVEIDPAADLAGARTSIEAYGDTCEEIDDIGDAALFCKGGFKAAGFTGEIVWVDDEKTYYVVYNFADAEPSKDVTLELARKLDA